ncbi:MAG: methyltransferase domain-containing protein [Alphaproteobacteria bacterium]|nr:methyltransferase domain-containing protein [Alphaproteobacteria bacterium]
MQDYAVLRDTMIESQVRTVDVPNTRIHAALRAVPRERFVPAAKKTVAYADTAIEVAPGRFLLDPRTFSKLLSLADPQPSERVLDVGCATGYSSAVLAQMAASVVALEQDADLLRVAAEMLPAVGAKNALATQGALVEGHKAGGPYDVIVVEGAIQQVPDALLAQLAEGGRLVAVLQDASAMGRAHIFTRQNGVVGSRADFDAAAPILAGFRKVVGFVF